MIVVCKAHIKVNGETLEVHLHKKAMEERYFWKHEGFGILLSRPYANTPDVALDNLRVDHPSATVVGDNVGILSAI